MQLFADQLQSTEVPAQPHRSATHWHGARDAHKWYQRCTGQGWVLCIREGSDHKVRAKMGFESYSSGSGLGRGLGCGVVWPVIEWCL